MYTLVIPDYLSKQKGTMRFIYAFNDKEPSNNTGTLEKHTVKGSKSVQLLSPSREEPKLPDDAFSYDFMNSNVRILV